MSLISGLKSSVNSILKVRDDIGADLVSVVIMTRTWSGQEPGDGTATDVDVDVSPSPKIVDLSHNFRIESNGSFRAGDLILKGISKQSYETKDLIDGSSSSDNVEKFYKIDGKLYKVISVTEKHLTWEVQVRRQSGR